MKRISDIGWAFLLVGSHLGFSYYYFDGWWYSFIGTLFILFFSYLIWGKSFLEVTGLRISLKKVLPIVLLTLLISISSYLLLKPIALRNGVAVNLDDLQTYFHIVFYVLNEEIVLGGIILYVLISRVKMNRILASLVLAMAFSVIHFVFFKWVFAESGTINFLALMTLFLIGVVRNNLIIKYKHIGYSWTLHVGWVIIMLGTRMVWLKTNTELTEPERFNIFLGSLEMIIISCIMCGLSMMLVIRDRQGHREREE